jgi:hypothetical protein
MRNKGRTRSYPVVQVLTKTLYLAIPVAILFIVVSWFSFSEIRKQNNLAVENAVNIYQTELEHRLMAIQHFVQWTVVHDPILDSFAPDKHMGDFRKASNDLRLRVSDMQYSTGSEYQYFFYWDQGDVFFNASEIKVDYDTYKEIREKITSDVGTEYNWVPCRFGDTTFLYYSITYMHRTFSCLVSMEDMLAPLSTMNLGEYGSIEVMSPSGEMFYKSSEGPSGINKYYYNRQLFPGSASNLPFSLCIESRVLGDYGRLFLLQFVIFLAALMLSFIMGGYILVSYKKVILPIKLFSQSLSRMDSVSEGEGLVLTDSKIQELNQINDQFKNLIHEITRLRIDIYEAELDKNKFMIGFLQQQIKPHFYLNCLTTVDSMVSLGDIDAAKKMLMFTSKYFRYLFQVNKNFVPLINELTHIEDYLSIQNMRLSECIGYQVEVPQECYQLDVPPLLLITFVENSVKHATPDEGENLEIKVSCGLVSAGTGALADGLVSAAGDRASDEVSGGAGDGAGGLVVDGMTSDSADMLEITICDNGQGFEDEVLAGISAGESLSEDGNHIGITNCIRRLQLLYGDSFELVADNVEPHGARVKLRLPVSH